MVVTCYRVVSLAAVHAEVEASTQSEFQMVDAALQVSQAAGSAWDLSLRPGGMALCPAGGVRPRGGVRGEQHQRRGKGDRQDLL